MPVTLVRHTRPDIAADICYGSTDLELAASFVEERDLVIASIEVCERLISSPLKRCRHLADAISTVFGVAVEIDERVREMDFGKWEGQHWTDIAEAEVALWADDFLHARPHGGESVAMLRARTLAALSDYRDGDRQTVIVTHSGVIKAALADGDTASHFDTKIEFGGIIRSTHKGLTQ